MLQTGWWVDAAQLVFPEGPAPTFFRSGPYPGMHGPGTSRIDTFLLNKPALLALRAMRYCYDLPGAGPDHAPLALDLDLRAFHGSARF